MDNNQKILLEKKIQKTIDALTKNRMKAYYVPTAKDALELVKSIIEPGACVSMGGTKTAEQTGIKEMLKNGNYNFLDRMKATTPEEIMDIYRKTFSADYFVTSSNAITENGELYNVDGNSNRVSAMLFGPSNVIVVAGYNKIVRNIDEAIIRVKTKAAPPNCVRLNLDNYCAKTGECVSLKNACSDMPSGCASDTRICCNYTVMAHQKNKDRVKVIIVGEELGY